jgi:flagellar hook assembly protein FlgD
MKTFVLTAALVVLTTAMFAQKVSVTGQEMKSETANVKVAMYSTISDEVTLIVVKQPEDKLNLKIKDENGSLVYEKRLRTPESKKITFDVSSLPDGKFTFELVKNREIVYSNSIVKGNEAMALIH